MIPLSVIVCVSIIPQILFYFTDIYYNTQGYRDLIAEQYYEVKDIAASGFY
jgi:hypothetical protein